MVTSRWRHHHHHHHHARRRYSHHVHGRDYGPRRHHSQYRRRRLRRRFTWHRANPVSIYRTTKPQKIAHNFVRATANFPHFFTLFLYSYSVFFHPPLFPLKLLHLCFWICCCSFYIFFSFYSHLNKKKKIKYSHQPKTTKNDKISWPLSPQFFFFRLLKSDIFFAIRKFSFHFLSLALYHLLSHSLSHHWDFSSLASNIPFIFVKSKI